MRTKSNRLLAVEILGLLLKDKGSLSTLISSRCADYPDANLSLVREYAYGACRRYHRLGVIAGQLLAKPLRKKDQDVYCLILLGLYQLYYMRTPDHAAINETVGEARHLGKPWSRGLVNAVLRQALRERQALEAKADQDPEGRFFHPRWLIDSFNADWPDHCADILDANNQQAPMTLRVNRQHTDLNSYCKLLSGAGIAASPGKLSPHALILQNAAEVSDLPGFAEGLCSVQDETSQLCALLLDPAPGARVLDACAAPGGKTGALLEWQREALAITALDNSEERLLRVAENLERLGLQANIVCADAASPPTWWDGEPYDAILLDAPCSGTGVIRRHPDIKLLRQPGDIERLGKIQQSLLDALWPCLKKGGKLLYATCSVLRRENEASVTAFLRQTPDARPIPVNIPGAIPCSVGMQLMPEAEGHDGFYYALLEKY